MFSWLKNSLLRSSQKKALEEIRSTNLHLKWGSDEENSAPLVATALAVEHLQVTNMTDLTFPEDALNGKVDFLDGGTVAYLSRYNLFLHQVRKQAAESPRPMAQFIASGHLVLINSIRGLIYPPPMLAEAREMWAHLCRGLPYYVQTYRELIKEAEYSEAIWSMLFLPTFLVPESVLEGCR